MEDGSGTAVTEIEPLVPSIDVSQNSPLPKSVPVIKSNWPLKPLQPVKMASVSPREKL